MTKLAALGRTISHIRRVLRGQPPPGAAAKCGDAEVCISCFVPSAGADIVRNAFVSRRTYDKLTPGIPAMDPVAFGQLATSLFGTRRSLREGAVVRSAVSLASGASHGNASGQI